ncbi:NADH dehydrogenase [ubiquinone] flavoprotein 3, mitochondrial [Morone saxatilis]|uniref:NADH dehydrogenase [ubiquinone] flavoprotein 3, mitochondrial n=1 Tax=Morone saxatilis TaxID=34816 RepID=UPI0015E2558A|nr:NADH dehydrogenase [ubiquinone] flavoprotein 3, mitochondrial [Morone saxatilis]
MKKQKARDENQDSPPPMVEVSESTVERRSPGGSHQEVKKLLNPVEAAEAPVEAAGAAEAEASVPAESGEELVDPAPVIAEAAGEELQADAPVEPSEEAAAAPPPEPEEPFDNSTYKNYQHHSYNTFTFADLDVEMAKFRLPQPSSIKP